jgi:phage terminase large subunit-like protein
VNETKVDMEYLRKSYAIGGCDLSATTDLTCATLLIKKPNDDNLYVLQKYFLPKSRVEDVENNSKREAPYRLWAEEGHLTICEGATVDYHAVTQWFTDMVELNDIRPLFGGYDAALSGYWIEEMREHGFDFEKIRQGSFTWTYPMKRLSGLLEDHKIIYNNNPMLRWCLLNTGVKTLNKDGINSIQPVKTSSTKRIDGMVSLLNAFTCYCLHEDDFLRYLR